MEIFNKLVRDKIPQIIEAEGGVANVKILPDDEYIKELDKKLNEEVAEYQDSKELEELADVLEVIYAICDARGYSVEEMLKKKNDKAEKRGGFKEKIFLISRG